jgi:hypothetical protein
VRAPRAVDATRFGLGLVAVARPDQVLRLSRSDQSERVRRVIQVLGARYLVQSAMGYVLARRWVPVLDAGIDAVHALSMSGLAIWAPRHRRPALLSAAAAVSFAAADLGDANCRAARQGRRVDR